MTYSLVSNYSVILRIPNDLSLVLLYVRVQIVLVGSKSFWSGPNNFGHVQIRLFWTNFYNLDLSKMIWT